MTTQIEAQVREALEYAGLLLGRYRDHGAGADLKAAIGTLRKVLGASATLPALAGEAQQARADLAQALLDAYAFSGQAPLLNEAVDRVDEALRIEPGQGAGRMALLNTRAVALFKRLDALRRDDDLDRAADAVDEMVRLAPDEAATLMNRAHLRLRQFDASGALENLDAAIDDARRCLARAGVEHRPAALGALAGALAESYALRGRQADIERALDAAQEALRLLHPDSPLRGEHLMAVGNIELARYDASQRLPFLDAAIANYDAAMPAVQVALPTRALLQNAGYARIRRFQRAGNPADLDAGILLCERAGADRGDGAAALPGVMANLGRGYAERYRLRHAAADLERARALLAAAGAEVRDGNPQLALQTAQSLAALEAQEQDWSAAHTAYQQALDAAHALFEASTERESRQTWLHESRGLGPRAAYAAARAGALEAAVLALERSRAVLWSDALRLRTADLGSLGAANAALAQRFRAAAVRCARAPSGGDAAAARGELAAVLAEVRRQPGFERWLTRPGMTDVAAAAADGPLVYLAAADAGGVALIVETRGGGLEIRPLWLPALTDKAVRERLRGVDGAAAVAGYLGAYQAWQRATGAALGPAAAAWSATLDELMRWCWDVAMGPLSLALPAADTLALVAAGPLGYLPLHAAWTPDPACASGRRHALDGASFTYALNATVHALALRAAQRRGAANLLAIENPHTGSGAPLPGAAFEVRSAARRFVQATVLRGADAGLAQVLRALPDAAVAHFCCHGRADMDEPRASALQLADGVSLTLGAILDAHLPRCRLALLSACETSLAGTQLPDEALSLQSALLQSGAAAAIATSWSVYDTSATMVAARFYAEWFGDPRGSPREALTRAQRWVRDSTNQDKRDWFASDPDAGLLGAGFTADLQRAIASEGLQGRSYAALLHWAGFNYAGA